MKPVAIQHSHVAALSKKTGKKQFFPFPSLKKKNENVNTQRVSRERERENNNNRSHIALKFLDLETE